MWHAATIAVVLGAGLASVAKAEITVLANSTYDNSTYMFVGTNNEFEPGLTITEDYSEGISAANNSHFVFAVVKFGDLTGLKTATDGGGEKFLKLTTSAFPGPGLIGVSVAQADIAAGNASGYPSPLFPGNPFGTNLQRLQWYRQNIKGDDPLFGGYAGGAPHVGAIEMDAPGEYYLDVTWAVDAWIDGASPNFGFGLWGITVAGEQGNTFDLVSMEHPSGNGPKLVRSPFGPTRIPGDANLDGRVDRLDVAVMLRHFGRDSDATWGDGDFYGDGRVSLTDLAILQSNMATESAALVAVPEPNAVGLALLGGVVLAGYATRRRWAIS